MPDAPVPPPVALWLQYLIERPEARDWLAQQAEQRLQPVEGED